MVPDQEHEKRLDAQSYFLGPPDQVLFGSARHLRVGRAMRSPMIR